MIKGSRNDQLSPAGYCIFVMVQFVGGMSTRACEGIVSIFTNRFFCVTQKNVIVAHANKKIPKNTWGLESNWIGIT